MIASAVQYCIQIDAACTGVRSGGAGSRLLAGTIAFSPYTPYSPCRKFGTTQTRSPDLEPLHARRPALQ